jgi:beta-N-acetylhexosaminidase
MGIFKRFGALMLVISLALLAGCGKVSEADKNDAKPQTLDDKVDAIVADMSLPEKVGQMVMIGVYGTEINDDSRYMLNQYHIGGVIFFDRNLQSAEQTKKLTADLQAQADKVPLFIAIDEEGGTVARGKGFIEPPPSAQSLGQTGDNTQAESWAQKTGTRLKDLGINVNFAPVADVGTNPREFSTDGRTVAKFVAAAAQGYESAHVIYTLKHFPGIGRGQVDSHIDKSEIPAAKDELMAQDLVPFKEIIANHSPENFMIMVSHLIYPALDKDHTASLSAEVQTKLLRQELGFNGVIVTDSLGMGAVSKYGEFRNLGVQAVQAGADIALVCHEYAHETDVYLGILEAAEKGIISEERINESVKRIVKMKLLHKS